MIYLAVFQAPCRVARNEDWVQDELMTTDARLRGCNVAWTAGVDAALAEIASRLALRGQVLVRRPKM